MNSLAGIDQRDGPRVHSQTPACCSPSSQTITPDVRIRSAVASGSAPQSSKEAVAASLRNGGLLVLVLVLVRVLVLGVMAGSFPEGQASAGTAAPRGRPPVCCARLRRNDRGRAMR